MPDRIAAAAAAGEARGPPALPPRQTHLPSPPLPRFHPRRRASERVPPLPPPAQAVRAGGSGRGWGRGSWAGGRAGEERLWKTGAPCTPPPGKVTSGARRAAGGRLREAAAGPGRICHSLPSASAGGSGRLLRQVTPLAPPGRHRARAGIPAAPLHPARAERRGGGREPRDSRSSRGSRCPHYRDMTGQASPHLPSAPYHPPLQRSLPPAAFSPPLRRGNFGAAPGTRRLLLPGSAAAAAAAARMTSTLTCTSPFLACRPQPPPPPPPSSLPVFS